MEGRGGAVAFDCVKQRISSLGRHLLLVHVDDKTGRSNVTVYDMKSKYVAFTMQLPLHDSVSVGRKNSYIHTHTYSNILTHIYSYIHTYSSILIHSLTYSYIHTYSYIFIHAQTFLYLHIHS